MRYVIGYSPVSNRATAILLTVFIVSFGLFAQSRVESGAANHAAMAASVNATQALVASGTRSN